MMQKKLFKQNTKKFMQKLSETASVFLKAGIFFLFTLLISHWLNWDIYDVSWSIWTTSFVISILSVFAETIFMFWLLEISEVTEEQKASPHYKETSFESNVFSSIFMFGVQMYLVVTINLVVALCLNGLIPFGGTPNDFTMHETAFKALKNYWPFLIISLIPALLYYRDIIVKRKYTNDDTQEDLLIAPYLFVFRNQAFMLIIMALTFFSNHFLTYWILLLFYFFPWVETWKWIKAKKTTIQ